MKKYDLIKIEDGEYKGLFRVKALKDFCGKKSGTLGGYVESEDNLSQDGDCWVDDDAIVHGNARVFGNALVYGNARVYENARVYGEARVHGDSCVHEEARVYENARVYGNARVRGVARVYGDARVHGDSCVRGVASVYGDARVYGQVCIRGDAIVCSVKDYIVFKNWWSSGRYFTWTRSNNCWCVGCFFGTGSELVKRAFEDSELSGREYERIVNYVNEINDLLK
jgi:carbonic anhydrase/acetyltransferase-like protein (isoleucine patch superfamily)